MNFWVERAAMVLDLVFMLRILMLKLRTTYLFITLYVLVEIFYDGVNIVLGSKSPEFQTAIEWSRFIYAVVIPLAVWDLFEEAKPLLEKFRKAAMSRMMGSLLFISLWGLLLAALFGGEEEGQSHYLVFVALVVWTGSIVAAIFFVRSMKRDIAANHWELPWNTTVWLRFFQILLWIEAAACLIGVSMPLFNTLDAARLQLLNEAIDLAFETAGIALTVWCICKLRAIPTDATNLPVDVRA